MGNTTPDVGGVEPVTRKKVDVVIVGAGFGGMYMLHRVRGLGLSAIVFEAGTDVGGTWYWNRYPGARCDVESMQYSFSFSDELQQEWHWKELYAPQPEILEYARHVAGRLDLRRDICFETRVTAAHFDEGTNCWSIHTDRGDVVCARFCVMATGCLSTAKQPELPGLASFCGKAYHTGAWPHEAVDLSGQMVGVIGTGSSAIQAIPIIAKEVGHLFVFQRTPNFSVPAQNRPMTADYEAMWKAEYPDRRRRAMEIRNAILYTLNDKSAVEASEEERQDEYEARWRAGGIPFMAAFNDLILDKKANDTAANFVRGKIRSIVRDPAIAEKLVPKNYPIGTKRICVDTDYFATYNRDNVTIVDLADAPIEAITAEGLRTRDAEYKLDSIIFATGFDAMTGTLLAMDIVGRNGRNLREKWAGGPRTYLGLMVAGFPNMFTITGPGSPSVLTNMIVSIEQHVEWIADCLAHLQARGAATIEATAQAENDWVSHVSEIGERTLYPQAESWYVGANVPGKPRVFMPYIGGFAAYKRKCDEVAARGYEGFQIGVP
ncbi:MAG: NAD(P)/FAD-dependent oxidoreductase [Rhodospirillales bacterium]|nr:NAD(P)/FAD-dependent oxidoreductase [Rhodospirillales bacterium]